MTVTNPNYKLLQARIQKVFKGEGGGVEEENFERKMFVDTVSTRVHIRTRITCNSFFLPFQEDCLLFFALFITLFYF